MAISVYGAAVNVGILLSTRIKETTGDLDDPTSTKHLARMLCDIRTGEVREAKAHRWLGYVQGVLVAKEIATLEEMKKANFDAKI